MTATYTFDVFSSLDGFGSVQRRATAAATGASRVPSCSTTVSPSTSPEQRMVFGANTYRAFAEMLAASTEESEVRDPWVTRMISLPATVVSTHAGRTARLGGRDPRER